MQSIKVRVSFLCLAASTLLLAPPHCNYGDARISGLGRGLRPSDRFGTRFQPSARTGAQR